MSKSEALVTFKVGVWPVGSIACPKKLLVALTWTFLSFSSCRWTSLKRSLRVFPRPSVRTVLSPNFTSVQRQAGRDSQDLLWLTLSRLHCCSFTFSLCTKRRWNKKRSFSTPSTGLSLSQPHCCPRANHNVTPVVAPKPSTTSLLSGKSRC
jgi:hypothetical protein